MNFSYGAISIMKFSISDSDDMRAELMRRRSDLASHVSAFLCFFERGDWCLTL